MKVHPKRCPYCGRQFRRDPRARVQKCCGRADCRRARKRQNLKRWRSLHPEHDQRYAAKERAWAKAFPDYWRRYRAERSDYRERERRRMKLKRRRQKRVANETGMRQVLVEKLRAMEQLNAPETVANETGLRRRMDAIEDCLRSTVAVVCVAKRNRLSAADRVGG
jgi:ferric-dicitrate binding protein FerR (iron transport regulator)